MTNTPSAQNYFVDRPWTWRERLRFKLMPSQPCMTPEAPARFEDCLVMKTVVSFSWLDRFRILLTGCVVVQSKTVTEFRIGDNVTSSAAYPAFKSDE